ncbi:MAG: pyridoxal kinase PdxY [Bosea sp. (in: a-proteobacteria)]|jgi:pyridoxine kinase|uniref:pyridoxal kinase PdxY n=1 Tax=Bosea sp. (in: a-proteobacteria) TaxID=1871050 RepID=UPI001D317AE7|nr:pyridoxal kinase PdxY [Bosea sp. (in: a-proteobacteria)]MBA4270029.1 pyridoxal kinase [Methylobacterium sp.]MBA4335510.1 pyridoxal kinase [Methylobacterium sp.]MDP3602159.1 pyridoxal kinase PdxY [Bosea sp. (in: a-proteobacteria)]
MNILSIQSHVAYGHVGNASAVFPMQRLGVEVWPIHTVQFSNHTGYGAWKGRVFDGGMIDEVMEGIAERGVLPSCTGLLSGYMGSADIGHAILSAVERVRAANPKAVYCCDPVMGDVGRGVFVRPGIPEFMREQAVPAADIVTPNQFELELLTDIEIRTIADAHRAVEALRDAGPKVVLVTSLVTDETPADSIDLMAADARGAFRVRTPKLDVSVNGAGDAIAALFFVHYLREESAAAALAKAAASVYGLLKRTKEAGSREILTVAAQDEFVTPTHQFVPEKL